MNLKILFGIELKKKLLARESTERIGAWAFSFYWKNMGEIDPSFENFLLHLGTMELGPEFAFTYEELEKIADNLILSKEVEL